MKSLNPFAVLIACLAVSGAVAVSLLQTRTHCNSASRMATVESLVHRGTFAIDGSPFRDTADRVVIEGRTYSSKPPMLPLLAAGGYLAFSELTGITFHTDRQTAVGFVNILTGVLPYLLLLYFFYRFLLVWTDSRRTVILGLLVFTFNFLGLGYATDFNNHTPAAACLLISFYLAFLIVNRRKERPAYWLLSGLLAGVASTFEFWGGFFALGFAAYLFSVHRRRTIMLFLPAAALPVAAHFAVNLVATGSLLPVYLRPELYLFRGGYWSDPVGIDALREPRHIYFFHILLGHHGLFSMTPVFLLAVWSMLRAVRKKTGKRLEAMAVGIPVLAVMLFLGIRTRNYGGVCAGFRWMIHAMPLLFLFVAEWIDNHRSVPAMVLLAILFAVGLAMLADVPWASAGPWHHSAWHRYVFGLY